MHSPDVTFLFLRFIPNIPMSVDSPKAGFVSQSVSLRVQIEDPTISIQILIHTLTSGVILSTLLTSVNLSFLLIQMGMIYSSLAMN